ncbi:MAG: energy transducer TonB, partial [Thermodesulfobacteriota bacterium]|nr:energy transducer TonB [Thermodesulfobacteriota bacterium]
PIPSLRPVKIEPAEKKLPNSLVERIGIPDIPVTPGLNIAEWVPAALEETSGDYATSGAYLEMLRLRIERHKKYPDAARVRHIEGRVTIRFVITPEGDVRAAGVAKTSRHGVLDRAALKAVKDAAPFPKPPSHLFKGLIPLEITILFELT